MDLLSNHAILLCDAVRMKAYEAAIGKIVRPGDVVVDVGCGLGALGFMALQCGAKKIYAIEYDPVTLHHARQIARQYPWEKQIRWIEALSSEIELPEKADVIVSETFGSLGLDENTLPTLLDARRRFLKPGGKIIPNTMCLGVVPVEDLVWNRTLKQMHALEGIDFLPNDPSFSFHVQPQTVQKRQFLAKPISGKPIDFLRADKPTHTLAARFKIARNGTLSGFAGWFETTLAPKVAFSTAPGAPKTHWKQGFLPLREPVAVKKGDALEFTLQFEPDQFPTGVHTMIGFDFHVN